MYLNIVNIFFNIIFKPNGYLFMIYWLINPTDKFPVVDPRQYNDFFNSVIT